MRTFLAGTVIGLSLLQPAARAANDIGWSSYNGVLKAERYSDIAQITPENAGSIREICKTALGDPGAFQPGPLVIGRTLFVTTTHTVVAVNATNCAVRWRYVYHVQSAEPWPANRGLAYLDGRLFRGTGDGWVIALAAATGREIWRVHAADSSRGEFFSAAPIAWNGLVFIGPAGGDWGIRGRILAFDARTGRIVWRFDTVPRKGEPGYDTWPSAGAARHGGGGTWTSYTLDPATGELFVPVGNPAPDFTPEFRPGDNLYTNSLVVLDARTGVLRWYHQFDKNDGYDYDVAAAPVLYTDSAGRRRVAVAGKDGYLYVLDRNSHELAFKTPVTTVLKPPGPPTPGGVYVCPGVDGGVEWNGPAYSPLSRLLYVGAVDWCMTVMSGPSRYHRSLLYMGTAVNVGSGAGPRTGWIYAISTRSGRVAWSYHAESPVLAGVTPTAGGVLFSGDAMGNLLVFNEFTGVLLGKLNLGGSLGGGVITYRIDGRQYVAATAGNISRSGLAVRGTNTPTLALLSTGLPSAYRPVKVNAVPPGQEVIPTAPNQGIVVFNLFCSGCHGLGGIGGETAPSLRGEYRRKSAVAIAAWIANPAPPMPSLRPPLTDADIAAVAHYVEQFGAPRPKDTLPKARPRGMTMRGGQRPTT